MVVRPLRRKDPCDSVVLPCICDCLPADFVFASVDFAQGGFENSAYIRTN